MITDVTGVRVGHWTDAAARTGCTVVLLPQGAVASGEVRGGAPAARRGRRGGWRGARERRLRPRWRTDGLLGTGHHGSFLLGHRLLRAAMLTTQRMAALTGR